MKKSLSKNSVVKVFGKIYLNTLRIIAEKVARHVLFVEKKFAPSHKGRMQDHLTRLCKEQWLTVPLVSGSDRSTFASSIVLCVSGSLPWFRAESFHSKEPETLSWIDGMDEGATLWDIGANVGLYSVYAAMKRRARVFAFEPSVFNLELLAKNIFANRMEEQIVIIPVPLSDITECSMFKLSDTCSGGACSTFAKNLGFDGKPLATTFAYSMMGICGDDVIKTGAISLPDYIKIDVDGIEHYILAGMKTVLSQNKVKSVLIEGNEDFSEQVEKIAEIMQQCGFVLREKTHSEMFSGTGSFSHTYNQIWRR